MIKPIYQISPPMCGWREVPKHIYDNPELIQRKGSPHIEYSRRIIIVVTEVEIAYLESAERAAQAIAAENAAMRTAQ